MLKVNFKILFKWSTGCQGQITVTNTGTTPVADWSISFVPVNFALGGVGDFVVTGGQKGAPTIIIGASWLPKTLIPGQSVASSFNGAGSFNLLEITDTDPRAEYVGDLVVTQGDNIALSPVAPSHIPVTPNPIPVTSAIAATTGKRSIGYYPNYAVYGRKYFPTDVMLGYLTDIVVAFMCPNPNEADYEVLAKGWNFPIPRAVYDTHKPPLKPEMALVHHDEWADVGVAIPGSPVNGVIPSFVALKAKHPHLKVHIADGGWSLSWIFSKMAVSDLRSAHVKSVAEFIVKNNIDGYNLDWEYPGKPGINYNYINYGGVPDKQTMDLYLTELRSELDRVSPTRHIELSVTFGADPVVIAQHKDCARFLDWAGVMTYDFSGGWTSDMSFHSGLYINPADKSLPQGFCGADAVANTLAAGIEPSKIMFGIPTYARGWKCAASETIFGKATGAADSLDPWGEPGVTSWSSLYAKLAAGELSDTVNASTAAAWGKDNKGQLWTYDNPITTQTKCDFIHALGLGGSMFWDVVSDLRDYSSPNSIIGTAVRRMVANRGATPQEVKLGSVTANVSAPLAVEVVPPGGKSGMVNPPSVNPPSVNPPARGSLTCERIMITNKSAAPIVISPGAAIALDGLLAWTMG